MLILGTELGTNSTSINNIDKENPTKPTNADLETTLNSINVKGIGGTDNLSGIAGYQYSLDNANWSETIKTDSSYLFSNLATATYTVYIRTVDNVGLVSEAYNLPAVLAVPVTGVSLNKSSISIYNKATQTLTATVSPSNATNKSVSWKSSNTAVATVSSSGVVTGVKPGTATITVTTADGEKTATCSVTVSYPKVIYLGTGTSFNVTSVCSKYGISPSSLTASNFLIGCVKAGQSGYSTSWRNQTWASDNNGYFSSTGNFSATLYVSPTYSSPTFTPNVYGETYYGNYAFTTSKFALPVYLIPKGVSDTSAVRSLGTTSSYNVSTICSSLGIDKTRLNNNNFVISPKATTTSGTLTTSDGTYLSNGYFNFTLCVYGDGKSYSTSTGVFSASPSIYYGSNTQTGGMMYRTDAMTFPLYFFPYGYVT